MDLDGCLETARTCTCFRLRSAARAVTRLFDRALAPAGLKATQYTVLVASRIADGAPLTVLAAHLGMDQSTLARAIRPLLRRGLLERRRHGADARRVGLRLTPSGNRLIDAAHPRWRAAQDRVRALLGERPWAELLRRLEAVSKADPEGLTPGPPRKHSARPGGRR